ncbi:MAG: glycoside hydrolase family 2 TIM barrel-domain containing protein [Dysgonomonas sp.]
MKNGNNKSLGAKAFLFSLAIIFSFNISAQDLTKLWTGLRAPQDQSELPKGKAPFQKSERIAKKNAVTKLEQTLPGEWIITNGWEMTDATTVVESKQSIFDPQLNTDSWYNATVPGTVLTTLVDQGVYPDPYFGLNNMSIPDSLSRMDWWYRTKFELPEASKGKQVRLLFEGINYIADVFLNGKKIGNITGAFIRGEFNVTDLVKDKDNVLAVHIYPPKNPGIPHEQSMVAGQGLNGGTLSLDGPTFISSIGWDWIPGIRDRNTGIWQDVKLKVGGDVVIGDPLVITDVLLPDTTKAKITIKTNIRNISDRAVQGVLTAKVEGINIQQSYSLKANEEKELVFAPEMFKDLNINKPRLWWPNGYGNPELYDLTLETKVNDKTSDTKQIRFGIRELSYELMVNTPDKGNKRVNYTPTNTKTEGKPIFDFVKRVVYSKGNELPTLVAGADTSGLEDLSNDDPMGPYIVLKVNGKRIFCRGGNWGMDDGMKRVSRERLEPYLQLHKDANFNIIRNWTGESTEELFYALCDEYGMLVWNDFWITTDDTVEPNDMNLFVRNATDVVRRYRNHPSIAVWCPRNEGFAPDEIAYILPEMVAKEDPTRHYHGQSRHLNMDTSGPWGYFKDPSLYYTQNAKGFLTEIGSFAVPTANTIRKFIAPEDQWPINDVWAYHDLHHKSQNFGDFINAVDRYGKAQSMEDFAVKAQFVTYDAWRNIMEAWNSKMWNNTSGQILWMSHPAWPSMIWQTYTYDYETPGSYFGAKKACEPVHIQMNLPNKDVMIVNTTLIDMKSMSASLVYIDLSGKELYKKLVKINAPSNSATQCFTPQPTVSLPSIYLARLELKDRKGNVVSTNDYWVTDGQDTSHQKLNDLEKVKVEISTKTSKGKTIVEISNPSKTIATAIKLNAIDKSTGKIILPAYFSDGYINLLAGEERKIELNLPSQETSDFDVIATGYNLE